VITKLIEPATSIGPTRFAKCRSIRPESWRSQGHAANRADADVTIIDPKARWTVDPAKFHSKSNNTPFAGMELIGRAAVVIVGGK